MAVSSPTHPIAAAAYHKWARNGAIVSGASQYGIPVILIIMELRKCRPHVLVALFLFRSGSFHFKDQYADWALTQIMLKSCTSILLLIQNNGRYSDKVWGFNS
jgi:hypothetical protein